MTNFEMARQRLYNQRLTGEKFATIAEAVHWLGAVQAQEYAVYLGVGLALNSDRI